MSTKKLPADAALEQNNKRITDSIAKSRVKPSKFYNQHSIDYNSTLNQHFYEQIADELLNKIDQKLVVNSILEIGAGTGFSTLKIRQKYPKAKITAIEPSSAMLSRAKEKIADVGWQNKSLAEFNTEEKFDLIISSMAAHWLTEKEWKKLLAFSKNSIIALALPAIKSTDSSSSPASQELKKLLFKLKSHSPWLKQSRHKISPNPSLKRGEQAFIKGLKFNYEIKEKFETKERLIEALDSRGVFLALFGDKDEEAKNLFQSTLNPQPSTLNYFNWSINFIIYHPV